MKITCVVLAAVLALRLVKIQIMKKLYLLSMLLLLVKALEAQITITNASFPALGDTLKTAIDNTPGNIVITTPGGPSNWDFSSLTPNANQVTVFQAASEGAAFANFSLAELVTIGQGGVETYYSVSATSFDNLGFSGTPPMGGLPVQTEFKFDPPVPERRAPLNFIDNHQAESSVYVAFSLDDIPGNILDSLGIPTTLVDSIRVLGTATRFDIVDAYGTLAIPGGSYEVLREKRTEYRDTRLEIHTLFGWIDVTDQLGVGAGFGKDTLVYYQFISNTEKEIIANVITDNSGQLPQQVTYKDNGIPNGVGDKIAFKGKVTIAPNPATDVARFGFENWQPGNYALRLFDVRGNVVMESDLVLAANQQEAIRCRQFAPGTYFYQVIRQGGAVVAHGQFIKQ